MTTLWTATDIAAATGGTASADFAASGVAFDSREVGAGDLFVALKGEATDGHRFVEGAFAQGAAGAIVSETVAHPHVLVPDTAAALDALGRAARARTGATVIGVTGSVGKTGTKEALAAALARSAPGKVHRSVKSYNNHTGVPLSLARMPADSRYGVFEMGMNHPGELSMLTRLVRPHIAIVTAIAPAHAGFFRDEAEIAQAKAEIFEGLEPGGTAIVPHDSPHRDALLAKARAHAARVWTFGRDKTADVFAREAIAGPRGTLVTAVLPGAELTFTLAPPGDHWVSNALALLAAVHAAGGDLAAAGLALADLPGLPGRGARLSIPVAGGEALLIDESYNANPASMAATLKLLGTEPARRRIAVLGEMRELGDHSQRYHAGLRDALIAARIEAVVLVGAEMAPLADALGHDPLHVAHVASADEALAYVGPILAPGDALLVKGSNGVRLSRLVEALTRPLPAEAI
ncbi:UDP-N-acetylmuramoyl-tripeptide--D-alanyl-D-alanine ligase [Sphingomonas jatrophae]|uniref:UDP-N-acetylmuramoyl-tripeptide--D-alanyl-D- alanine ligase n=1 Tax=Sphingomonas jatrophae TaxID=1166337 RepID=UPI000B856DB0|nr:UDP-N-acetylmuramoyl-tripeptide--D-alanyl-D-alanine ligase [Sphingomonas jatrophae]